MRDAPLRIGHLSTFYHTSFILEGVDWLQKEGLDVQWRLFASGPDIVKAFEGGMIDLGYLGLPPAVVGIARGVPIKCVAGGHVEGTVMIAQAEYLGLEELGSIDEVLKQFDGKAIGTPPKGSIHDVIARDIVRESGYDIEVKNYQWADFVLEAITDRELPAAIGTPPLAVASRRFANTKIVVPPSKLWPYNPSYGILVSASLMRDDDTVIKFLQQHERACAFVREDPHAAARIVSRLVQTVDPEYVLETYKVSPKYCAALPSQYVQSTMVFVKVLKDMSYISRLLPEKEIFEHRFIRKAHPGRPHYDDGIA
ncbi:MAG TPA: ABC transporter substrate-binding protein [Methanomassiliicoccales archaeon]|nr:ABC transporter substrate-binding protein [Methanomassiliicoccales archaeon]